MIDQEKKNQHQIGKEQDILTLLKLSYYRHFDKQMAKDVIVIWVITAENHQWFHTFFLTLENKMK